MTHSFKSDVFEIPKTLAAHFAEHLDGNPVHLPGNSNEILPEGTVPGLCVMALASKALLKVPAYKEVLCARGFEIKFKNPVFSGQHCQIEGVYNEEPHRSRPGVLLRKSSCKIFCVETKSLVIEYEITQLVRA